MRRPKSHKQPKAWQTLHRGFTLTELLVATGILLILLTITVAVYSSTASADRVRSSARQVQSAVNGARDRAMKAAKNNPLERRGLRFLVDSSDASLVTSMVYVGNEGPWSEGKVIVGRADNPNGIPDGIADSAPVTTVRGYGTGWSILYNQGLLVTGARIKIPNDSTGTWYTVDTSLLAGSVNGLPDVLILSSSYASAPPIAFNDPMSVPGGPDNQPGLAGINDDQSGSTDDAKEYGWLGSDDVNDANPFGCGGLTYLVDLKPSVLPGQEPLRLSSGIAIDLDYSKIPRVWYDQVSLPRGSPLPTVNAQYGTWVISGTDASTPANDIYRQYSPWMDVMFAPQGSITGPASVIGTIVFRLAETDDILLGRNPADPQAGTMLYSALFTQAGYVATFPVDITDTTPNDGFADDPLYFVRRGGTAGK